MAPTARGHAHDLLFAYRVLAGAGPQFLEANRYVEAFEQKWVRGDTTEADELLGSGDIQWLADLGDSYAAVKEMRSIPFDLQDMARLAAVTAVPLLPLGLTVFSHALEARSQTATVRNCDYAEDCHLTRTLHKGRAAARRVVVGDWSVPGMAVFVRA
jgi:hypothetical protein